MASIDERPGGTYRLRGREYPGGRLKSETSARKVDGKDRAIALEHSLRSGTTSTPSSGSARRPPCADRRSTHCVGASRWQHRPPT
ncbi:hypothetical protein KSP35_17055 [Aquihabitans sp. G128]|uniref:hypothetical protein n=1 Tax=Aquihabitans sp. G128 TaxID=2849779 RepID=UPI001C238626|nr:hypothetical protein [Aquihabitans sp. G128]QXC60058.1 hypothetical protein KSP35_17055 [Aquihabitans sp. G128]